MPTIILRGSVSAYSLGFARNMASGGVNDDYFEYVSMLLPGNGTNGAQNNTFLDSSSNNFTLTRNGNPTQGTFSPYGSNWSMGTSATGSYLTVAQNTAFAFGTGDFTIEAWVNRGEGSRQQAIVDCRGAGGGAVGVYFFLTSQAYLTIFDGTSNIIGGTVATVMPGYQAINTWAHVAATRSGTTTRLFINGTIVATLNGDNRNYANGAGGTLIARQFGSTANDWVGYISNVRIVKGTALYTANFTPSTTPLTAVSGTSLLTCQSNSFVDNSGNNFTVTPTGTPRVQRYSPFSPTASYSAGTVGGSGYFDGTGDYLDVADNAAFAPSTSFTVEAWIYPTVDTRGFIVCQNKDNAASNSSWYIYMESGRTINAGYTSGTTTYNAGSSAISLNTWTHVAGVWTGTNVVLYINGVQVATTAAAATPNNSSLMIKIGAREISGGGTNGIEFFNGYMTDVRYVNNVAVYTGSFTPPTAPLTAVTGTSLLCKFTNSGIIDNAMMNDLETVGNAQISTTQSKFGGSSMYFDGTGDWLQAPPSPNWDFGSGDFTIEMWLNPSSKVSIDAIISKGNISSTGNEVWALQWNSTSNLAFFSGGGLGTPVVTTTTAFSTGTWYFVAVTRASGTTRIFVNGTLEASSSTSYTVSAGGSLYVGAGWFAPSSRDTSAYIDDLRITKGYARYTANFTAPTAAFPTS